MNTVTIETKNFKRRKNTYGWKKDPVSPNHFCKVVVAPNLGVLPIPDGFRPYLGQVPGEIKLKTNTDCVWSIQLNKFNGRACLDQGWAPFASSHNIGLGYNLLFEKLGPMEFRVIIFDNTGCEIVRECPPHPMNLTRDD